MLDVQDITVAYSSNAEPTIEGFHLKMKPGEICSIVGESGSGKTTVIRSILGLLPGGGKVTKGDILFEGESLLQYSKKQWRELRGTQISMIFQDSGAMINPIRKIGSQYVEYIRAHKNISKKDAFGMAVEMLEKMRLPDGKRIMESYPFELSGGMCQRVGIAMAMTFQPKLLLADEPTSALDVTTQAQIVRQMMELRDDFGTGIIVVTHNIGVAAYMADKLLVMRQGKVVDSGQREDILHNPQSEYTKNLLASVPALKERDMSKEKELILEAKHVTKKFPLTKGKELIANDDVSLKFYKGQTLGIVGESGCGKSTFMRMMVQLEQPTSGEILFKGKDITKMKGEELRKNRRNVQMVFQNPSTSFNPKMKVGDIICEPLMNFGLIKKKEKDAVARKYLEMVELPGDFVDRYPHNMSGGQRQRVGIARAIALEPEIIFCDESTSALDVSIQKAILELLVKLQKEKNIAIGFICHDLAMISSIAHQIAVMYMGNIVEILPGEEVARGALHPYTKALLQSVFDLHMDFNKPITPLEGEASMPTGELQGCPFQNRCAFCMEKCQKEKPELKTLDENHQIACWRI